MLPSGSIDQLGNELRVTCRASLTCLGQGRKRDLSGLAQALVAAGVRGPESPTPRDTKVKLLKIAKTLLNDGI